MEGAATEDAFLLPKSVPVGHRCSQDAGVGAAVAAHGAPLRRPEGDLGKAGAMAHAGIAASPARPLLHAAVAAEGSLPEPSVASGGGAAPVKLCELPRARLASAGDGERRRQLVDLLECMDGTSRQDTWGDAGGVRISRPRCGLGPRMLSPLEGSTGEPPTARRRAGCGPWEGSGAPAGAPAGSAAPAAAPGGEVLLTARPAPSAPGEAARR